MNKHRSVGDFSIQFAFRAVLAAGFLTVLTTGPRTTQAQTVANFTGGNDTNAGGTATPGPDTYKGTAGNGWAGAYAIGNASGAMLAATVATASPLSGGGNYLSLTDTAASGADAALTRSYNGVPNTSSQTISFDYRLDTTLTAAGYVTVGDAQPGLQGVNANSSFIIRDYATTTGSATANQWAVYNGVRGSTGFNTSYFVSSGLTVTPGDVYHFTVNLNPSARTYTVTIADTTAGTSFTSGAEGFRTDSTTLQNTVAFNDSVGSTGGSSIGYSVDSISIQGVPEPSTWIAGLATLFLGLTVWRRRVA